MNQGLRRAAVGIPGFCAFLILYAPQSLLPALAQEFGAAPADISLTMTADGAGDCTDRAVRRRDRRRSRAQARDRCRDDPACRADVPDRARAGAVRP